MEPAEYERMYNLEDTYWWFQGRKRIVLECLKTHGALPRGARILDVGCGTGLMLKELRAFHPVGIDFSSLAMKYCRRRGADRLVQADVNPLPFRDASFDLVLALDLLEHVERDDLLARDFRRVLRPGGLAMMTVPAHDWLWSEHDEALHHYRRYSAKGFRRLLVENGLQPVKYTFAITTTYYPIVWFRRLQRWIKGSNSRNASPKSHVILLPALVNRALIGLLNAEARWLRRRNFRRGVSLLCLARRA